MRQETLFHIKKQIKPLVNLVELYNDMLLCKDDLLTAMMVAIGNATGRWEDCYGYTLAKDIAKMEKTIKWLAAIKQYAKDYHYVVYIIDEVTTIYDGNCMSEDYE